MRVQAARFREPELLNKPEWPLLLANQIFSSDQKPQSAPTAPSSPDWTVDSALRALDQAMESTCQKLMVQLGTSPLGGRFRSEQSNWFEARKTVVTSQPREMQSAVALRMTSERATLLNNYLQMHNRSGESWKSSAAGAAPRGKILSIDQAAGVFNLDETGSQTYLVGTFVVTAVDRNRAVLRAYKTAHAEDLRVIVEYPPGQTLPGQGSILTRNPDRGFLIREIRRDTAGTKTILAREMVGA